MNHNIKFAISDLYWYSVCFISFHHKYYIPLMFTHEEFLDKYQAPWNLFIENQGTLYVAGYLNVNHHMMYQSL